VRRFCPIVFFLRRARSDIAFAVSSAITGKHEPFAPAASSSRARRSQGKGDAVAVVVVPIGNVAEATRDAAPVLRREEERDRQDVVGDDRAQEVRDALLLLRVGRIV
jgi:hypothetical protein